MEISTEIFEKAIISEVKPKTIKPRLKVKKGYKKIDSTKEMLIKNFNRNPTRDKTGIFILSVNNKAYEIIIDIDILRVLEAVFKTVGRYPEEMEAICLLQQKLIENISSIKYKDKLIKYLKSATSKNYIFTELSAYLAELCENGI